MKYHMRHWIVVLAMTTPTLCAEGQYTSGHTALGYLSRLQATFVQIVRLDDNETMKTLNFIRDKSTQMGDVREHDLVVVSYSYPRQGSSNRALPVAIAIDIYRGPAQRDVAPRPGGAGGVSSSTIPILSAYNTQAKQLAIDLGRWLRIASSAESGSSTLDVTFKKDGFVFTPDCEAVNTLMYPEQSRAFVTSCRSTRSNGQETSGDIETRYTLKSGSSARITGIEVRPDGLYLRLASQKTESLDAALKIKFKDGKIPSEAELWRSLVALIDIGEHNQANVR
jgi:hypothetical protein